MGHVAFAVSLLAASWRAQMQYWAEFVFQVLLGILWQGTGLAFILLVLERFHAVGGWTAGEVAFLFALRMLIRGLTGTFLYGDIDAVAASLVRDGEFDRYLVRPVPPLLHIVAGRIWIGSVVESLFGIAVLLTASALVQPAWTPLGVAYLSLAIVGGSPSGHQHVRLRECGASGFAAPQGDWRGE